MTGMEGREFDNDDYGFQFHQAAVQFHQRGTEVPANWILLDNQSTVDDVFANGKLLTNIRKTNRTMRIRCNAGVSRTNMVGNLKGYGEVWYNPKGIANILSLSQVEKKYRVTYDSAKERRFTVHKPNGATRHFNQSQSGLFYLDTTNKTGTVLVNTV
jgi:hypothetical protein